MNRISLSKSLAFVFFVVGVLSSGFAKALELSGDKIAADIKACVDQGKAGSKIRSANGNIVAIECIADPDKAGKVTDCRATLKEINKSKDQFIVNCKTEEGSGSTSLGASHKLLTECSDRLTECSATQTSSMDFSGMLSAFGMPGMDLGNGNGAGTCSKYTQSQLDNLIKEVERKKKDSEKDVATLKKDLQKALKDAEKDTQDIQEEFVKLQEAKDAAETDGKEKKRNNKSALEDRQAAAQAEITNIDAEISSLQSQQRIMVQRRQLDVASEASRMNAYKSSCNSKTQKEFAAATRSNSLGGSQAMKKEKQAFYASCMNDALNSYTLQGSQFVEDMQTIDRTIANKMTAAAAKRKSLESLNTMYAESLKDAAATEEKAEAAFQQRRASTYQKFVAAGKQAQQLQINATDEISKASQYTLQAGNELSTLKGQTTFGDKTASQLKTEYLSVYNSSLAEYKAKNCGGVDNLPTYESLIGQKESSKPATPKASQ